MSSKTMNYALILAAGALGVAGAVVITTASPSRAAPVVSNTAPLATAAANQVTNVRHNRRRYYARAIITVVAIIAVAMLTPMGAMVTLWGLCFAYLYRSYAYPYSYPYAYSYLGFGFGWGGWW